MAKDHSYNASYVQVITGHTLFDFHTKFHILGPESQLFFSTLVRSGILMLNFIIPLEGSDIRDASKIAKVIGKRLSFHWSRAGLQFTMRGKALHPEMPSCLL